MPTTVRTVTTCLPPACQKHPATVPLAMYLNITKTTVPRWTGGTAFAVDGRVVKRQWDSTIPYSDGTVRRAASKAPSHQKRHRTAAVMRCLLGQLLDGVHMNPKSRLQYSVLPERQHRLCCRDDSFDWTGAGNRDTVLPLLMVPHAVIRPAHAYGKAFLARPFLLYGSCQVGCN